MQLGTFNKRVLLTGAGLSKNWGAKLASELWNDLISHPAIQNDSRARQALLEETQFEAALSNALAGRYGPTAYDAIVTAVYEAFVWMDRDIAGASSTGINVYGFQEFLRRFGQRQQACFAFTVNQDLLIERKFYNHYPGCGLPSLPGITDRPDAFKSTNLNWFEPNSGHWLAGESGPKGYESLDVVLPDGSVELQWPLLQERFNYVKLHGSFNWRDCDRRLAMVMGTDKEQQIRASGLFNAYARLFRDVLTSGNVRLMTLGYGFTDPHINQVIAKSAIDHGLTVFIWDIRPAAAMQTYLRSLEDGERIWGAVRGYEPARMAEVFPVDQSSTACWLKIQQRYFESS